MVHLSHNALLRARSTHYNVLRRSGQHEFGHIDKRSARTSGIHVCVADLDLLFVNFHDSIVIFISADYF